MKKLCIVLICIFVNTLPCFPVSLVEIFTKQEAPNVFIYHIPEEEPEEEEPAEEKPDIISDDVTADTSGYVEETDDSDYESEEIKRIVVDEDGYQMDDMYSDVLKGYASYDEGEENAVSLDTDHFLNIQIQRPYNYKGGKYLASKSLSDTIYSKFSTMEYSIKPLSSSHIKNIGSGFSAGTMFNQGIDYAELEQTTGVFSRYDKGRFGLYTAFAKTLNSTNSNYNDNFYISPELKLNQFFTLKEILSADITRNRKKAELVLSINPFGKKDYDRLRIDFGANATFDEDNSLLKNQIKFSTIFKL